MSRATSMSPTVFARGLMLCASLLAGCTTLRQTLNPGFELSTVSTKVNERMPYAFGTSCQPGQLVLPNGASLEHTIEEDEAVLIALWNNALFQELLRDLGIARGDLIQAGLLPNPEVLYYSDAPFKPYRYLVDFPLESLWLRPIRIKAAKREAERVQERLTQTALDLIRDVRQSYADILIAQGRLRVAELAVKIRSEIARLAEARLKEGDVSEQEAAAARIAASIAEQEAVRTKYDVSLAEERFRNLLAIGADRRPLRLDGTPPPIRADLDAEQLSSDALATRPDILAADRNVAAAEQRVRLAKLVWFRFVGIADATTGNLTDHELGPGLRVTLPVFNWNQGSIARARADLERAERNRQTVGNQIILDIHNAHYRYTQARAELEILETKVRPEIEALIRRAESAYQEGETPYVVVLQTTQQFLDAELRLAILHGELRRSWAELERGVGHHLDAPAYAFERPTSMPKRDASEPEKKDKGP